MTAYTEDDVAAGAAAMEDAFTNRRYKGNAPWHDGAEAVLAAVAPSIAARALREAADAMESEPGVTFADALMIRWLRARAEQVGERGRKDRGTAGYSQEDQDNLGQCGR